jgi:2,5-diketo-D-gluconate reductase A
MKFANGVRMPVLGLGTSSMSDTEAERIVAAAIDAGYRSFDTAEDYGTEPGVGRGIRASGIDREEVFITTKFNRKWHSVEGVRRAFEASADRLGVERIDLFLIHWPNPDQDRYVGAWKGLVDLLEEGLCRSIGVSNFLPAHIDRLIREVGVAPHLNQIQLNPYMTRTAERAYHSEHGIVTESWTPIARGRALFREAAVVQAAEAHGKTPAQVVLRWHIQSGLVTIPKTVHEDRLRENLDIFDFELDEAEMTALDALDRGGAGIVDPESFGH